MAVAQDFGLNVVLITQVLTRSRTIRVNAKSANLMTPQIGQHPVFQASGRSAPDSSICDGLHE